MAPPISYYSQPKIIEKTFSFPEFAPACKKSFHSIYSFLRYSQFQSPMTRLATSIFNHADQKIFDKLLIYVNSYQQAKNQAILMIFLGDMVC